MKQKISIMKKISKNLLSKSLLLFVFVITQTYVFLLLLYINNATRQRGINNATQQCGINNATQQCGIINATQQHRINNAKDCDNNVELLMLKIAITTWNY